MGIAEGLGRGGEELWNAEGIQPSTEESDPPTPTLFISLEGVASRDFHDLFQAVSAGSLAVSPMGHLSGQVLMSPGPEERTRGLTEAVFSPLPISQTSKMDRDGQGDTDTWEP